MGLKNTVAASELAAGHSIYDYMQDGERKTRRSASVITHTWRHGPLVTVLTARGYVEYDAAERVPVPVIPEAWELVAARMKAEINAAIAAGTVPASVSTFAALHDYMDANMLADDFWTSPSDSESEAEAEARNARNVALFNAASGAVNAWLASGREAGK